MNKRLVKRTDTELLPYTRHIYTGDDLENAIQSKCFYKLEKQFQTTLKDTSKPYKNNSNLILQKNKITYAQET